ncbi:hypothetical protein DFH06DRAFT_1061721 [Mycena polygramma]|nr:hypothetical protein DFH06DRAFT_1061721 [Mycena polygramma]
MVKKTAVRRSPRKHTSVAAKQPKSAAAIKKAARGKKDEPPLPRIDWSANEGALTWGVIAEMDRKENRLVLFGKQSKAENTSGDSKIAVYKRIGGRILPDLFAKSPNALGKRVKGKAEDLIGTYKKLAKQLQVTGGGLRNDDDDDDSDDGSGVHQFLECYISAEGPDHDTTEKALNIWEKLTSKFEYFPALHKILAARSNIVPPMIATGVGPEGRKVVHLQPPSQTQASNDNIDPSLLHPQTPHRSHEDDEDEDEDDLASSPILISSSPSPPAADVKPLRGKTGALPSTFQRAVNNAKAANGGKQKPRTFEENLVDLQTKMLEATNSREDQKLELDRARLKLEEINQLINLHRIGVLDNETLTKRVQIVHAQYAPKRAHSPEAGSSKRARSSASSDGGTSQPWDRNRSSPIPGSDRSLGYR